MQSAGLVVSQTYQIGKINTKILITIVWPYSVVHFDCACDKAVLSLTAYLNGTPTWILSEQAKNMVLDWQKTWTTTYFDSSDLSENRKKGKFLVIVHFICLFPYVSNKTHLWLTNLIICKNPKQKKFQLHWMIVNDSNAFCFIVLKYWFPHDNYIISLRFYVVILTKITWADEKTKQIICPKKRTSVIP